MFGLHHQISTLKQNGSSIVDYYQKLNALWKQYDAMVELPKCVCNASESFKKYNQLLKLMQFFMGLDDSYMQIRSSILSIEVLPDVRSAYATISSEESHRVSAGSIVGSSQRNQASTFKSNQSFKGKNASSNNYVEFSSSSGFTDEQMTTLLSLIKDNKIGKNVQANMAGANQHMTYTDKELDNILDISHLKIKVGHPNGTEAFISKIGNLKLSNSLILYDVLDLSLRSVLGTGSQCEGLLRHPADPVLNVLKKSLQIDNNEENLCCEGCQRAKQTREPFPLSDHVSSSLGDLDHLDLWGAYKVTSSEGLRYFLTVVDDNTRVVWIPNDDERVDPKLNSDNKSQSASSSSSESGRNSSTSDFSVNSENDADSSDNIFATQNERVTTVEENVFSEGNLDQNPSSSSQDVQNLRRSSRQSVFPRNYNDFVVDSKVKYGIEKYVGCEIDRFKARIVAQGFGQKEGINYEETFSPVVKMVTIRCLLNIVMFNSWPVDVNNAFLYGDLDEIVYIKPPEGYFPLGVFLSLLVYVDDIIITGNNVSEIEKFKVFLKSKFMIKDLEKLKYFLGIEMLESVENEPLVYPTIEENGQIHNKKYAELNEQEKL
ncbi:ribonuclease H-like domain-containing protein [Tanacetum coccineum]